MLELRAAVSLARLWQSQGKIQAARQMLAEVYGRFDEGFDSSRSAGGKRLAADAFLNIFSASLTLF